LNEEKKTKMGRIQTAFNIIACVGAAFHIFGGILAVYFLIPKSDGTEEILSRRARSLHENELEIDLHETKAIETILIRDDTHENLHEVQSNTEMITQGGTNSNNTALCYSAKTCTDCLEISKRCFWFETSDKSYCFDLDSHASYQDQLNELYERIEDGIDNISWGSCAAPLTVSIFMLFSLVLVVVIFMAFCVVHLVCSTNKEAEMLIEADLAAQNEKYLTRLGRLNPLPINKDSN